jgi:hypothetical protein
VDLNSESEATRHVFSWVGAALRGPESSRNPIARFEKWFEHLDEDVQTKFWSGTFEQVF